MIKTGLMAHLLKYMDVDFCFEVFTKSVQMLSVDITSDYINCKTTGPTEYIELKTLKCIHPTICRIWEYCLEDGVRSEIFSTIIHTSFCFCIV